MASVNPKSNVKRAAVRLPVRGREDVRLVPVAAGARVLTEAELGAALLVDDDNPLWLAVNQILMSNLEGVRSQVAHADTAREHGALAHCAGGMEWLGYVLAELNGRRDAARKGVSLL